MVAGLWTDIADTTKFVGVVAPSDCRVQLDGLIAPQAILLGNRTAFGNIISGIRLEPRNEKRPGLMEAVESGKIQVTAIHDVVTAGQDRNFVQGGHLVTFSLVQTGESREIAPQVQQDVQLHGRMVRLPTRPRKRRRAQFDDSGIQGEQIRLQLRDGQLPVYIHALGTSHQHSSYLAENTPIAMIVGVGKIGSSDSSPDAHLISQGRTVNQTGFDSAQTFPIGKLCINKGRKMIVYSQRFGGARHRKALGRSRQFRWGHAGHNLGKNSRSGIHTRGERAGFAPFLARLKTPLIFSYSMILSRMLKSRPALNGHP